MKLLALTFGLATIACFAFAAGDTGSARLPKPTGELEQLRQEALTTFRAVDDSTPDAEAVDRLSKFAKQAIGVIGASSERGQEFVAALEAQPNETVAEQRSRLFKALQSLRKSLETSPLKEADLPENFPTYTPAGVIQVKTYPVLRKVAGPSFMPLFRHIQRNNVAMTTPVEMTVDPDSAGNRIDVERMSFYYGSRDLGEAGADGTVEVVDEESIMVVATGSWGRPNKANVETARQQLQAWLEAHPEYEAADKFRVMGYSSPFVLPGQAFFEVQLPIEKGAE